MRGAWSDRVIELVIEPMMDFMEGRKHLPSARPGTLLPFSFSKPNYIVRLKNPQPITHQHPHQHPHIDNPSPYQITARLEAGFLPSLADESD